jgi:hypothetical protein
MTLFLRTLLLGYGAAAAAAAWLSASGMTVSAAILFAWVGGNVLGLAFAAIGAALRPERPARRSSFTATEEEFLLWDEDLSLELIDADLRRERPPAAAAAAGTTGTAGTAGQELRAAG